MGKKKIKLQIIIPKGATTDVEQGLVYLTEYLDENVPEAEVYGGGLGGDFGYGGKYENDVFMMHPFCWCEREDCGWCSGVGAMPQLMRDVMGVKYSESERLPNFLYKPTKTKIWWYKWIGRGQEQKGKLPKDWLKTCIKSLTADHHI